MLIISIYSLFFCLFFVLIIHSFHILFILYLRHNYVDLVFLSVDTRLAFLIWPKKERWADPEDRAVYGASGQFSIIWVLITLAPLIWPTLPLNLAFCGHHWSRHHCFAWPMLYPSELAPFPQKCTFRTAALPSRVFIYGGAPFTGV